MDTVFHLLVQRRLWVLAVPLVVYVGQYFGVSLTEELLNTTGEKVVAGVMQVLAAWSYVAPKPAA